MAYILPSSSIESWLSPTSFQSHPNIIQLIRQLYVIDPLDRTSICVPSGYIFLLSFLSHVRVKSTCNGISFLYETLCKNNVSHVCVKITRVLIDLLWDYTSTPIYLLFYLSNSACYLYFYKFASLPIRLASAPLRR